MFHKILGYILGIIEEAPDNFSLIFFTYCKTTHVLIDIACLSSSNYSNTNQVLEVLSHDCLG